MAIGKSILRRDGRSKVTGQAKYTDDFFVSDMLHAKIFRSTIANGIVKTINIEDAKKLKGVVAVFTYEDVPKQKYYTAGHPYSLREKAEVYDKNILTQRVRFYGDEIAMVVAENEFIANKALGLIKVTYEEFSKPILTINDAIKLKNAEKIHEEGNLLAETIYGYNGIEEKLPQATNLFTKEYFLPTVQHCALENHSAYAYIDENEKITIVTTTQIPHLVRQIVGIALGIKWGQIRVIKPYIGGGFGSKQDIILEPLVAFLTSKLGGRPVRISLTREETFVATRVRHAMQFKISANVNNEGKFILRHLTCLSDTGAYASHGHSLASKAGNTFLQLYEQEAAGFDVKTFYTNKPIAGAMRAYGIPQLTFAMESHVDDLAYNLRLDPLELRLKNITKPGSRDLKTGIIIHSNALAECIEQGSKFIKWQEKRKQYQEQKGTKRYGVGMACFTYKTAVNPISMEIAGARMMLNEDGTLQLQVGATEIGQGSDTAFCQMAGETTGVKIEDIFMTSTQDTDLSPFDSGAYASRQSYVTGMAVRKAGERIKAKILKMVSKLKHIPTTKLDIEDGWVVFKENAEKIITVKEIATFAYTNILEGKGITADVSNKMKTYALAFGCTFAEIEVDLELGQVKIINIINVHDSGKIINPKLAEGQVHGGMSMSIGYGLYEQMLFDEKTGKVLNANLLDYKLMTALDTPDLESDFVEPYEPTAPYGNKALGEPPAITPAVAIRNAILHATGVSVNQLPITPFVLVKEFQKAGLIKEVNNGEQNSLKAVNV